MPKIEVDLPQDKIDALARGEIIILRTPKKKGGVFLPKMGEKYCFLDAIGNADDNAWVADSIDEQRLVSGNCFRTSAEATQYGKYITALYNVKKYIAEEFDEFVPDWEDYSQEKYFLCYDHMNKKWMCGSMYFRQDFQSPTFATEADCQKLIANCESDLNVIRDYK